MVRGTSNISVILPMLFRIQTICTFSDDDTELQRMTQAVQCR